MLMAAGLKWLVLSYLLTVACADSQAELEQATDRALGITSQLYKTVRNIAFPQHHLDADEGNLDSRFLMLMPGKVLNYLDYHPGPEYAEFTQNPNAELPEAVVPPRVMEKWFDLADNIPNYNAMNAQDTGKSLANIYRSIIHQSKLLGLEAKTQAEKAKMAEVTTYLNELMTDPENITVKVPRLSLYERYRDRYNDRRLEMEDLIEDKRTSTGYVKYELWFQRNYPSLQSKVESAYTKWLIFGCKETVELYITYMDSGSSGKQLEEARMALRASGVTSLDRTRTIYPVSFEPSNWYIYLLPEEQAPSPDQLRLMQGRLQSKQHAITSMITALQNNAQINTIYNRLKDEYQASQNMTTRNTSLFMNAQINCLGQDNCADDFEAKRHGALTALMDEADSFTSYQHSFSYKNNQEFVQSLQEERSSLQAEIDRIRVMLSKSSPYLGGLLDDSNLAVANLSLATRDRQWLQFEYDSQSSSSETNTQQTSTSVRARTSFRFFFFSAGGSYSYNKNAKSRRTKMMNSNLRVKGELLRVNIKRPWFKPELFEMPDITFQETHDDVTAFVSPGREFTETGFYDELSKTNTKYKLPEYTTGFLLARKIELEFSGLDKESVKSAVSQMSRSNGGGGFLFFRASYSRSTSKKSSHTSVQKTASGMKIKIPGAQVIGYYTQVVPRFPVNQKNTE